VGPQPQQLPIHLQENALLGAKLVGSPGARGPELERARTGRQKDPSRHHQFNQRHQTTSRTRQTGSTVMA
jgi:hypothetical protein